MVAGALMRIEARGVTRKAGKKVLLRGASLEILAGGIAVVIGPNGAGKTTLLRILGLLDRPGEGEVLYDGRPMSALRAGERTALRRRLGFIFQHPLLLNGTVAANLRHALALRKRPFEAARVEAALAEVGLAGRDGQDIQGLSGGEKQRLQLARALILDPEVLLADEPTSNLDPLSTRYIEDRLLALAASGRTVILATHNIVQARLLGDHLFFLKDGEIIQTGTPGQVLGSPAISLRSPTFCAGVWSGRARTRSWKRKGSPSTSSRTCHRGRWRRCCGRRTSSCPASRSTPRPATSFPAAWKEWTTWAWSFWCGSAAGRSSWAPRSPAHRFRNWACAPVIRQF
jgi:ABC-type multidrug transport system ATPase subunit